MTLLRWLTFLPGSFTVTLTVLQPGLHSNFVECESFLDIKLSLPSCSMWEKIRWLNWFWQFLFEGLSSFHVEGFYYSYVWSCSLCEGRASFCVELISRKLYVFLVMLLTSFSSLCLTSFSIDPLLHLYTRFFILFHLTLMTFCQSTHLAMCLVDFNSNLFWWNW